MKTTNEDFIKQMVAGYRVLVNGAIRSNKTGNKLTPYWNNNFLQVTLSLNGINKGFYVHRLVADAYLPNPSGYHRIIHKDGNVENNIAWNLERVYSMKRGKYQSIKN